MATSTIIFTIILIILALAVAGIIATVNNLEEQALKAKRWDEHLANRMEQLEQKPEPGIRVGNPARFVHIMHQGPSTSPGSRTPAPCSPTAPPWA